MLNWYHHNDLLVLAVGAKGIAAFICVMYTFGFGIS